MKKLLPLAALVLIVAAGCGRKDAASTAGDHAGHDHGAGGGHAHRPLMGGQLVALGDHQYNLELKFDMVRGVLQAWVLDAHAENYVRVGMTLFDVQEAGGLKRTITLHAQANEISGETVGDTALFEGEARWLGEVGHFDGVVKAVKVRGVDFRDVAFHFHPNE